MAKVTLWQGVGVAMQSVIGAPVTITAISKASPGVVSATGHGFANGEYVLLSNIQGMLQVNNRIFRVASTAAGTFALEGEDTTLFDTFSSGQAQKVTFGTTFSTLLDCSVSGGEFPEIDTTTIHDTQSTSIPGLPSGLVVSSNSIWDVSDAGLIAAKKASDVQALRGFLFTFQNGQKFLLNGYIGATLSPAGSAKEKVTTSIKITGNGGSTTYAS
jgi:Phage tail tube protein, TTP/Ubiquitin-activating enzyme E1 FCCH domain